MDDDVTINLTQSGDKAIALEISDSYSKVNFMLSDKSVINQPPPLKELPNFQLKIKVDTNFITRFIGGKSALPDTDTFTVITSNGGVKLIIGYSSINTNRVTIPVETTTNGLTEPVTFNANLFKEMLVANKECKSAVLEVSNEGLAKVNFKIDDYDSTYYIVAMTDVD